MRTSKSSAMLKVCLLAAAATLGVGAPLGTISGVSVAWADSVAYSVNGQAVTDYDIKRRAAFLRIQGRKASTQAAADEMIDQTIRMQEAARVGIRISQAEVDAAFARFAANNKMAPQKMAQILGQAGVTVDHFKDFIRAQMSWGQVLQVRQRSSGGGMSKQDLVSKMLELGGNKPTATEYVLQQVIFVVPQNERSKLLKKRVGEANALRNRFTTCDATYDFAKGLVDVTVRNLGRVLEPELPPDWQPLIVKTAEGQTTTVRTTERGAEFIAVCRSRQVSDDRVAELKFQAEETTQDDDGYFDEIKKKARIVKR